MTRDVVRSLNHTELLFCEWNAQRLSVSLDESTGRYLSAQETLPGGYGGAAFRSFCDISYQLFRTLVDDSPKELVEAYQFHSSLHFMRMLSYQDPLIDDQDVIFQNLKQLRRVNILDFGCGLAHYSRALAEQLMTRGIEVALVLADIPTIRQEFLAWVVGRIGLPFRFVDCTTKQLNVGTGFDVCVATEVFEHLYDPLHCLNVLHASLNSRAFLLTNLADHKLEFMHVTPNLLRLREQMAEWGYVQLRPYRIYQKP